MLSSAAARASELLAAALVAGAVLLAAAVAGVWWLRRRIRRRLGRISRAVAGVAGRRWLWSRPLPDRHWLAVGAQRRRLWRAVSAAEHAVAAARQAGAPTGDLDSLCRRLRHAAEQADLSLSVIRRVPASGREPGQAGPGISDLVTAAGVIEDAAASAVASLAQPAARALADDARQEAEALAAGITSAARAVAGSLAASHGQPATPASRWLPRTLPAAPRKPKRTRT